ncbi:hypothetical protein [Phytohabitans rumicis]|uniref:Uncharacterized protein n=2 Tax=Phytohabitans rumicis TaxID=1076125 RepID=A0A6V8KZ57_9ACTN|nr:hypothetical protein [Phytohabitans rumicis]GFJ90382.1 hypothetical protein Prum_040240 [Phytohabitans rumicis]
MRGGRELSRADVHGNLALLSMPAEPGIGVEALDAQGQILEVGMVGAGPRRGAISNW